MNPGQLRHRIQIIYQKDSVNEFGEPIKIPTVLRTIWAAISPAIGRNYYAAEQTQTDAKTKINTRYFSDIKRDMQIKYGDILYDIVDIQDVNMRHEELVIYCSEVTTK